MQYEFKQTVYLCNQHFKLGFHEVSEEVEEHPYFMKLVASGLVLESKKKYISIPVAAKQQSKELLDRLIKRVEERKAKRSADKPKAEKAPKQEVAPEVEQPKAEPVETESKPAPKKKGGKKKPQG